jgi:hypothetical protein
LRPSEKELLERHSGAFRHKNTPGNNAKSNTEIAHHFKMLAK